MDFHASSTRSTRKQQDPLGSRSLRLKSGWKDVHSNLIAMDQFYDASFYNWIKNESNVHISSTHLKRIIAEFPVENVSNGLKWLISDWTLGAITLLLKKVFTDHFWPSSPYSHLGSSILLADSDTGSSPGELASNGKRKAATLFDLYTTETSHDCFTPNSHECICLAGVTYSKTHDAFGREVEIIAELVAGWSPNFVGELLCSLMSGWSLPQKEYFLFTIARKWSFQQVSDVFLHLGNALEWQVKLGLLKKFGTRAVDWKKTQSGRLDALGGYASSSSAARRLHHRRKRSNLMDERSVDLIHTALTIAHEDSIKTA